MRAVILLLIFLIIPQNLKADCTCTEVKSKKISHHKVDKVTDVERSKNIDTKGRYKLVTYYKDGKVKHKYIDTQPTPDVFARDPASPSLPY